LSELKQMKTPNRGGRSYGQSKSKGEKKKAQIGAASAAPAMRSHLFQIRKGG